MTTNHSPEPWSTCKYHAWSISAGERSDIIHAATDNDELDEANAERAVQCVNACAGIPDPAAALKLAREALRNAIWGIEGEGCNTNKEWEALAALNETP